MPDKVIKWSRSTNENRGYNEFVVDTTHDDIYISVFDGYRDMEICIDREAFKKLIHDIAQVV